MEYISKNMNYIYNVEYFEGLDLMNEDDGEMKRRNQAVIDYRFSNAFDFEELESMEGFQKFSLYTSYPGLLIGLNNPHEIVFDDAIKCGYLFDYVTGLPYIPGSSVKGVLHSFFPEDKVMAEQKAEYEDYIRGILCKDDKLDMKALKANIFDENDVFFGAYPKIKETDQNILEMEYTAHHRSKFASPILSSFLKVKPNIEYVFYFKLSDFKVKGEIQVEVSEKLELFKNLIIDGGIGTKTNVGFGHFSKNGYHKTSEGY